jgi:hypothetical protein
MLCVGQDGETADPEFGDSEERAKSLCIVGSLAPVKARHITGFGHAQKGSRTRIERADSALW